MTKIGKRAAGVAALAVIASISVSLAIRSRAVDCRDLGRVADIAPNTVAKARCAELYVIRFSGEPFAVMAESPHMPGERVAWNNAKRIFLSAAHGESFTVEGQAAGCPCHGPLLRCPTTITDGRLRLPMNSAQFTSADLRSACSTR